MWLSGLLVAVKSNLRNLGFRWSPNLGILILDVQRFLTFEVILASSYSWPPLRNFLPIWNRLAHNHSSEEVVFTLVYIRYGIHLKGNLLWLNGKKQTGKLTTDLTSFSQRGARQWWVAKSKQQGPATGKGDQSTLWDLKGKMAIFPGDWHTKSQHHWRADCCRQHCRLTICIELVELTNSIRWQDPNNDTDTETGCLV